MLWVLLVTRIALTHALCGHFWWDSNLDCHPLHGKSKGQQGHLTNGPRYPYRESLAEWIQRRCPPHQGHEGQDTRCSGTTRMACIEVDPLNRDGLECWNFKIKMPENVRKVLFLSTFPSRKKFNQDVGMSTSAMIIFPPSPCHFERLLQILQIMF